MGSSRQNPPPCRQPAGGTSIARRRINAPVTTCIYECPGRVTDLILCGNIHCVANNNDKGVHGEYESSFASRYDSCAILHYSIVY